MSKRLPKLTSPSSNTTSDIATLQEKLLKSLNTVFEPTATSSLKSDENFLATDDYTTEASSTDKYFEEYKNPYQALAEKAKTYVKQKETENLTKPKKPQATVAKKNPDTFLITSVGIEGNVRKSEPSSEEEDNQDPLPEIDDREVLGTLNERGEYDDLAELRRMIKDTKREMKDYGKELIDLKNVIADMNDFAFKELGYSANHDLMRDMESAINDLGAKNSFKFMKKSQSSSKNIKVPPTTTSLTDKAITGSLPKASGNKSLTKPSTSNILESRSAKIGAVGTGGGMSKAMRGFGIKKI